MNSDVVGARELKTRLGTYLRRVRQGRTLIVTYRGRPVAEIKPITPGNEIDAVLLRLAAEGRVTLPTASRMPRFRPIKARGGALRSDVIIEDREDRF